VAKRKCPSPDSKSTLLIQPIASNFHWAVTTPSLPIFNDTEITEYQIMDTAGDFSL
jgi:hypothetical protein